MPTVRTTDHGRALCNPRMGWVHHHYDNSLVKYGGRLAASDTLDDFPGLTTAYLRMAWCYLEPAEGRYDWSVIDAPLQRWRDVGKRVAIRVSCCESGDAASATPGWVRDAGAAGHWFKPGQVVRAGESDLWEPDYNDPVFLSKLDRFLGELARRYDGDPAVDFVDVGSFGVWGEGHTFWSTRNPYDADTVIRHVDLHLNHFKRTPLVANWTWTDHGRGPRAMDYALSRGMLLRSDSILVLPVPQLYHPEHAAPVWPCRPVVLESEHYGNSVERGVWGDGSFYLQAVEEYHASYVSCHWWPREFLEACRPLVDAISRRMGYRVRPATVAWDDDVAAGGELRVAWAWQNAGVAPCYPGGHPAVTLKDAAGGIVATVADPTFDVRRLPVGAPGDAPAVEHVSRFRVPANVEPGTYDLFASVGSAAASPAIELPLDGGDRHRRYRLGKVTVTARA